MADAVRTGQGMFEEVNGLPLWEALAREPEAETVFNASMARRGTGQAESIIAACDLAEVGVIVDVGGGNGAMLEALLTREPRLRGVVADRPEVAREAEERMAAAGLADRCSTAAADFFAEVPQGGDAYVLSSILHDWEDEDCVRILRVVRDAMAPGARLWIVEKVLDPDPPRSAQAQAELHLVDLHMLVLFAGRERTSAEYAALLAEAGFDPPVVHAPMRPGTWSSRGAARDRCGVRRRARGSCPRRPIGAAGAAARAVRGAARGGPGLPALPPGGVGVPGLAAASRTAEPGVRPGARQPVVALGERDAAEGHLRGLGARLRPGG